MQIHIGGISSSGVRRPSGRDPNAWAILGRTLFTEIMVGEGLRPVLSWHAYAINYLYGLRRLVPCVYLNQNHLIRAIVVNWLTGWIVRPDLRDPVRFNTATDLRHFGFGCDTCSETPVLVFLDQILDLLLSGRQKDDSILFQRPISCTDCW